MFSSREQIMRMSELLMCCRINTLTETSCWVWTLINLQIETDLMKCFTSEHCFTIVRWRSDSHTLSDAFQAAHDWFYGREAMCRETTCHEETCREATSRKARRPEATGCEAKRYEATKREQHSSDGCLTFTLKQVLPVSTLTCLKTWTTWFEPRYTECE